MTFLRELIAAASGATPVPELLRKVKVLGSFTGAVELEKWANLETYGYKPVDDLPTYRGPFPAMALGDFITNRGDQAKNVAIPEITFPKENRGGPLFTLTFDQGAAQIQNWAAKPDGISFRWHQDAVVAYNMMVREKTVNAIMEPGWGLLAVKLHAGQSQFEGILDAIRNTALDLALELQKQAPDAGEPDADPSTNERAVSVVNNFYLEHANLSGSNNVLGGSEFSQKIAQDPEPAGE
ncbi:hypothetical protein [Rhodococcus sp. WY5]|uniref:AbiTii domain-containing protein n=1 Tax=Rhodococcus sp. WY5 TaxID=2708349 RepID=UPI002546A29F|nr:hypothetical protein [Rhodococcus sp. WY5]